jgi:hypothetical protein
MKNLVINEFAVQAKSKFWYIKEATKNNFVCRSRETGNFLFVYTNRGNLWLNPEFFSLVPELHYLHLVPLIEKRFPELEIRFTHKTPLPKVMDQATKTKVAYSKF